MCLTSKYGVNRHEKPCDMMAGVGNQQAEGVTECMGVRYWGGGGAIGADGRPSNMVATTATKVSAAGHHQCLFTGPANHVFFVFYLYTFCFLRIIHTLATLSLCSLCLCSIWHASITLTMDEFHNEITYNIGNLIKICSKGFKGQLWPAYTLPVVGDGAQIKVRKAST